MSTVTRFTISLNRLASVIFVLCHTSYSWGSETHEIVARIAGSYLSETATEFVASALGLPLGSSNSSSVTSEMVRVSAWADDAGRTFDKSSEKWHYFNVADDTVSALDIANVCSEEKGCLARGLGQLIADASSVHNASTLNETLRYIIHLVADIYQPLHVGKQVNDGGHKIRKLVLPEEYNQRLISRQMKTLHVLWDVGLPILSRWTGERKAIALRQSRSSAFPVRTPQNMSDEYLNSSLIEQIEAQMHDIQLGDAFENSVMIGNFILNIHESYCEAIACQRKDSASGRSSLIPVTVDDSPTILDEDYIKSSIEALPTLIIRAGLRLAQILNAIATLRANHSV
jgi:hypothetical protein